MLGTMTALWRSWKRFAHGIIRAQNLILMSIAYIVAMGPVSILIKLDRNRRLDRGPADPEAKTYGLPAKVPPSDVRRAQRPY